MKNLSEYLSIVKCKFGSRRTYVLPCLGSLGDGVLSADQSMDTVDHILNESSLGHTESSLVGDIVGSVIRLRVLSVDTSDLNVIFVGDGVELVLLLGKFWKLDMDGSSQGGTKVSWARGDVTEMSIVRELSDLLNGGGSSAESVEDFTDTSSFLHGDDSELIFFINPNEESLGLVVEDTSTGWPVSVQVACFKESVSLLEQEVVSDELLSDVFAHAFEWVEGTSEVSLEFATGFNNFVHDLESLLFADTWSEWISGQVSSDSDSSGGNHSGIGFGEVGVLEARSVHAGNVLGGWSVTVVLLNNFVEKFVELGIRVVRTSVEADSGIKVCDSREAASLEADASGAGLVFVLVPDFLGQVS